MYIQACILSVNPGGLAYVESSAGEQYPFTFDKIIGYRGEYPKELKRFGRRGLRAGVQVLINLETDGRIKTVEPL
jgi:hypothetical protein